MRALVLGLAGLLAVLGANVLWGQQGRPAVVIPAESSQIQLAANNVVPLITEGLHLSDFVGMEPPLQLRDKLTRISGFVQVAPNDGQPATQNTEVWLGHTRTTFYMVFVCHDDRPAAIRGHLARRENVLTDDNVSVLLDAFQDRRKGIL